MDIKKRILIIEDDLILARMYQKMLLNHNFYVAVAEDGEQGLAMYQKTHHDLVLLDIRMPVMDGMTVLGKIREDKLGINVPVILFTNLDMNDERFAKVVKNQPAFYLIKSNTSPQMLIEKINDILNIKK